jgi:hypothetical protein
MIVLLLVFAVLHRYGGAVALLGTLFVALDCWIVLTNRMDFLENMQLIPILVGVWFFLGANETGRTSTYVLAGLMFGLAIDFKHIGVYLVIATIATWLLVRKDSRGYFWMLTTMALVVVAYVLGMGATFGQVFFDQEFVQFNRLIGTTAGPGLNYGPVEAFQIIVDRYWVFVTTVVTLLFGWLYVVGRYLWLLFTHVQRRHAVLLSWAFAGFAFAVASQLKSTTYLILWLMPLYMYLAVEISDWARDRSRVFVAALAVAFVALNLASWDSRIVQTKGDSVRDAVSYINDALPADTVIGTETFIGALIVQPYVDEDTMTADGLKAVTYLAYYTSSTYRVTDLSPVVQQAIQNCRIVEVFSGFKDKVTLCKKSTLAVGAPWRSPGSPRGA